MVRFNKNSLFGGVCHEISIFNWCSEEEFRKCWAFENDSIRKSCGSFGNNDVLLVCFPKIISESQSTTKILAIK